jgi:hypothetical protein
VQPADLAFSEPEMLVTPPKPRRRGGNRFIKALLVFLVLASAVAGVLYSFRDQLADALDPSADERKVQQLQGNFTFRAASGWRSDHLLRDKMRANLAISCKKPRGYMALYYRDYSTRAPGDAELLDQAVKYLRDFFPQMEYINPFSGEKEAHTGELSGEPAIVFTFSAADADNVPMTGQCYMLTRQGYAYWLLFWGPEDYHDQLFEQWEVVRQGFKLHDQRDGWKSTPREMVVFTGALLPYQLRFGKDLWQKEDNPKDADETAELLLRGFEPSEGERGRSRIVRLSSKAGEIKVLILPRATDLKSAVTATHEHIRKKLAETTPGVKIEPVMDRKTGKPIVGNAVGDFPGQVDHLNVQLSSDSERYYLVAVTRRAEGVLAIVCDCKWDRRDYWEQEFKEVVATIRESAKEKPPPMDSDDW